MDADLSNRSMEWLRIFKKMIPVMLKDNDASWLFFPFLSAFVRKTRLAGVAATALLLFLPPPWCLFRAISSVCEPDWVHPHTNLHVPAPDDLGLDAKVFPFVYCEVRHPRRMVIDTGHGSQLNQLEIHGVEKIQTDSSGGKVK